MEYCKKFQKIKLDNIPFPNYDYVSRAIYF